MILKEYIAHRLIGTPLEGVARNLRDLTTIQKQIKHPELKEIYLEYSRIKIAMQRIINASTNCIDVGAHLGSVISLIKQMSPDGKHIAIEPIPYKYKWLRQKFPDLEVLQFAISDTVGEVDFFLQPNSSGFSGLRLHNYGRPEPEVEIIKVKSTRLDDIVPLDLPIGFIKIDVEGGELSVLRSAESILKRYQPIILFECTESGLLAHDISAHDIYDFLDTHSYSIFLIKDWIENGKALSYEQFSRATEYPFQAFNFLAVPKKSKVA